MTLWIEIFANQDVTFIESFQRSRRPFHAPVRELARLALPLGPPDYSASEAL